MKGWEIESYGRRVDWNSRNLARFNESVSMKDAARFPLLAATAFLVLGFIGALQIRWAAEKA